MEGRIYILLVLSMAVFFPVLVYAQTTHQMETPMYWNEDDISDGILIYQIDTIDKKLIDLTREAFGAWNEALNGNIVFKEGNDPDVVVIFEDDESKFKHYSNGNVAGGQTYNDHYGSEPVIQQSSIVFNVEEYTKYGKLLRYMLKHEVGHVLGLIHSNDPNNIMTPIHKIYTYYDITSCDVNLILNIQFNHDLSKGAC